MRHDLKFKTRCCLLFIYFFISPQLVTSFLKNKCKILLIKKKNKRINVNFSGDLTLIPGQLDLWFDPSNNGVNKEARRLNYMIKEALQGTDIQLLDLTHLSEFRADAHPAIWLGKKDAVAVWGQDCMHWCLPGVPDTWVDILSEMIRYSLVTGEQMLKKT